MTRPGVGLYGGLPFVDATPVVTLDLPVVQVREVAAGETVGYGNTFIAPGPMRIATLCGGYADGLIRAMGNNATLTFEEHKLPLVGRVSMDMITVDVSNISANIGDEVILWGDGLPLNEIANTANTIGYELTARMPKRVPRIVIEN